MKELILKYKPEPGIKYMIAVDGLEPTKQNSFTFLVGHKTEEGVIKIVESGTVFNDSSDTEIERMKQFNAYCKQLQEHYFVDKIWKEK